MKISSFPRGQHRAVARALQVHDHAGTVLQPQVAAAGMAKAGLAGAFRVSAEEIGNAGKLVNRAGSADFLNPATGTGNSADHFERIPPPLVLEGAGAAAQTCNEVLGDRHAAEGGTPATLCAVGVFII